MFQQTSLGFFRQTNPRIGQANQGRGRPVMSGQRIAEDPAAIVETDLDPAMKTALRRFPAGDFAGSANNQLAEAADAERLLRQVGGDEAWNQFGASGWGKDKKHDHAIFVSTSTGIGASHATSAKDRLQKYYTPELERQVDEYCSGDYYLSKIALTKRKIFAEA